MPPQRSKYRTHHGVWALGGEGGGVLKVHRSSKYCLEQTSGSKGCLANDFHKLLHSTDTELIQRRMVIVGF